MAWSESFWIWGILFQNALHCTVFAFKRPRVAVSMNTTLCVCGCVCVVVLCLHCCAIKWKWRQTLRTLIFLTEGAVLCCSCLHLILLAKLMLSLHQQRSDCAKCLVPQEDTVTSEHSWEFRMWFGRAALQALVATAHWKAAFAGSTGGVRSADGGSSSYFLTASALCLHLLLRTAHLTLQLKQLIFARNKGVVGNLFPHRHCFNSWMGGVEVGVGEKKITATLKLPLL